MGVLSNPFVEDVARPLFRQWYRRQTPRVLSAEQRAFWDANGYLVLPGHFTRAQIDAVNSHIDQLWQESRTTRRETVVDIFIGTPREQRTRLSDAPLEARHTPHKLNDLYLESDVIRRIVLEERLASVLEEVLEGPPLVCNSLNLEFGSQQRDHTDSLYMTAPVGLYLAASWIALEDGSPDSGRCAITRAATRFRRILFSTGAINAVDAEMPRYYEYMLRELERRGDQGRDVRAEDWRRVHLAQPALSRRRADQESVADAAQSRHSLLARAGRAAAAWHASVRTAITSVVRRSVSTRPWTITDRRFARSRRDRATAATQTVSGDSDVTPSAPPDPPPGTSSVSAATRSTSSTSCRPCRSRRGRTRRCASAARSSPAAAR